MKIIRPLMRRRQFLVAAGLTSTAALGMKKLSGIFEADNQGCVAAASEGQGASGASNGYSKRYRHLLSPFKIGNVVLKNKMLSSNALPHYLQGPENFPSDAMISHYANVAKNGAAVVTFRGCLFKDTNKNFDINDSRLQNYLAQMADAVHFYDSKMNVALTIDVEPEGYDISGNKDSERTRLGNRAMYRLRGDLKEIPVEMIQKMIEDITNLAKIYQSVGFDMVNFYMAYRSSILANSLSPAMNKRTDKYGGSLENRARLSLELARSIKKACGQDFLIEAQVSGEEEPGGFTIEDLIKYAKLWEGSIDILQIRNWEMDISHPMGYHFQKGEPLTLGYAEAIKKSGVKIVTAPVGGFQDLDMNEEYIASGKTDMIAMARAFIADPEYGKKAYEGRGEDVVPCVLCNKCHGNIRAPQLDVCTVNPKLGFAHKINRMVDAPTAPRKVAVIGGGPAGMKAALVAAERGHKVTVYEKNDFLGGLLRHADFALSRWPLKDYKDYLIRQMEKAGIEILLNTEATPGMIEAKGYDAVMAAVGAEPIIPRIPGADGSNVYDVVSVYGREKELGKNVVVVGGDLMGTQTGMHLAEKGHKVVVLTGSKELVGFEGAHQDVDTYLYMENFSFLTEVLVTRVSERDVTYKDSKGNEASVKADSVVIYAGFKPRRDEALTFSGSADRFFSIGDCRSVGGLVRACTRTAFAAASQI